MDKRARKTNGHCGYRLSMLKISPGAVWYHFFSKALTLNVHLRMLFDPDNSSAAEFVKKSKENWRSVAF